MLNKMEELKTKADVEAFAEKHGVHWDINRLFGRRTGETTRMIDDKVQYLFTNGSCSIVVKQGDIEAEMAFGKLLTRLDSEHFNNRLNNLVRNKQISINGRGLVRTIKFDETFFALMPHKLQRMWENAE
jgi:hypothetical protein